MLPYLNYVWNVSYVVFTPVFYRLEIHFKALLSYGFRENQGGPG